MFLENLNSLMKSRGYNKNSLAKESGIPYTTIVGFYTKGTDNLKLSTLRKLSDFFEVSLDYLINGENLEQTETPPPLTVEEIKLFNLYKKLNKTGKQKLIEQAELLTASGMYTSAPLKVAARNGNPPEDVPENPDDYPDAPDSI